MGRAVLIIIAVAGLFACRTENTVAKQVDSDASTSGCAEACAAGWTCNEDTGLCECDPEPDPALCERLEKRCGTIIAADTCGQERTVHCGACTAPETCDENNQCRCVPESTEAFCARHARACGSFTAADNCGNQREGECGDCGEGNRCADGACEPCGDETDQELCDSHGMDCGSPVLVDSCGRERSIASCGECSGFYWCEEYHCVYSPPTCGSPQPLDFADGVRATAQGHTGTAANDWTGRCGEEPMDSTGGEAVYAFTLAAPHVVEVVVTPSDEPSAFWPVAFLTADCGHAGPVLACGHQGFQEPARAATPFPLPPGVYHLVVDGMSGSRGPFAVEVTLVPPPANDQCAGALPLSFLGGMAVREGTTRGAAADYRCISGTGDGADVVYTFSTEEGTRLTGRVTFPAEGGSFETGLVLRTGCDSGDAEQEVACVTMENGGSALVAPYVAPGAYYLVVIGGRTGGNAFQLELLQEPVVVGDDCATAIDLNVDPATGRAYATGSLREATNTGLGSCFAYSTGPDLVYRLTLDEEKTVRVTNTVFAGGNRAMVYLQSTCGKSSTELACSESPIAPAQFTLQRLPKGTYFIWVDCYEGTVVDGFDLVVETADPSVPPPNGTCGDAAEIVLSSANDAVRIYGDTTGAGEEYAGRCAATPEQHAGSDVVYRLELKQAATLLAVVKRDPAAPPAFEPVLYLRSVCDSSSASHELACATTSFAKSLVAGTYYLFVDGNRTEAASLGEPSGSFVLDLATRPSADMPNDTCAAAQEIVLGANGRALVAGTTQGKAHDLGGSCDISPAPDVVFRLRPDTAKDLKLSLLTGQHYSAVLHVRTDCESSASELVCQANPMSGTPLDVYLSAQAGKDYYIVVDGYMGQSGLFTLLVEATDPAPPPAHDTCDASLPLTLPPSGSATTVSGSTAGAGNDLSGTCATTAAPLDGADVVYAFNLGAPTRLTARLTPKPGATGFWPALYLRPDCQTASAAQELCQRAPAPGPSHAATLHASLTPGSYYLVVDGVARTSGDFDLELLVEDARYTGGDHCINALALELMPVAGQEGVTRAAFGGDLSSATDDGASSCLGSSGPDVVYAFSVARRSNLSISVWPEGSESFYRTRFHLRRDCADPASEVLCRLTRMTGEPQNAQMQVERGTYFLWIDTVAEGPIYQGRFAGELQIEELAPAPDHDVCANAQPVAVPARQDPPLRIADTTTFALHDYTGSCATGSLRLDGSDLVYALSVQDDTFLTARVKPTLPTDGFRPALYIRSGCDTPVGELCAHAPGANESATVSGSLKKGTYYLIVDGVSGTFGDFELEIGTDDSRYVAAEQCLMAESIDDLMTVNEDGSSTATFYGNTLHAADDASGSCQEGAGSGSDQVFSFSVMEKSVVDIKVEPDGSDSALRAGFHVRKTCSSRASELECRQVYAEHTPAIGQLLNVEPGTYYLWIESYSTAPEQNGPFKATVTITSSLLYPAHDTCAGAMALPFTGAAQETITLTDQDTRFARDQLSGGCGTGLGPDVVYTFTTQAAAEFVATVTPDASPAYKPMVYLRTLCADETDPNEWACSAATTGGTAATIRVNELPAGTYYLVVDGVRHGTADQPGLFKLEAALGPPKSGPTNDSCVSAQEIRLNGGIGTTTTVPELTTVGAVDDSAGSCTSTSKAPDVVYRFDLPVAAKVDVTLVPGSGYRPAVYLKSACGGIGSTYLIACASVSSTTSVKVTAPALHPGTYFIWADSSAAASANWAGPFSLQITLSNPDGPPPPNDTCETVLPLLEGVTVAGDTTYATNDYEWGASDHTGCLAASGAFQGTLPDVVYTYTPSVNGTFKVTARRVTPSTTATVWVGRGECGNPRTCIGGAFAATAEVTVDNAVAGSTYYIIVEARGFISGAFAPGPYDIVVTRP